ncbi:MAG: hypothetical protein HYV39_01895 [Candidatus Levybacteria bacterium]|nr:hypothetical protein [Candidatus Levybacteria bacterium]
MILRISFFVGIFLLAFTFPHAAIAQTESATLIDKRQEAIETRQATREAVRERMQERKKDIREKAQQKREEAKEKFKAKRETLKIKIEKIKDERKKTIVERIDNKLSIVNTNRTDRMLEHLEKLSSILEEIKERAVLTKADGKDTTAVDTAISAAQNTITNAQNAVVTQAGKEYIITITTEQALKNTIGKTVSQLQQDLKVTYKAVVDAKQAVQAAARELAKIGK